MPVHLEGGRTHFPLWELKRPSTFLASLETGLKCLWVFDPRWPITCIHPGFACELQEKGQERGGPGEGHSGEVSPGAGVADSWVHAVPSVAGQPAASAG